MSWSPLINLLGATGSTGFTGATGATGFTGFTGYFSGAISRSIIPTQNEAFDLGSDEFKFRRLYVSQSTIVMGGAKIESDDYGNFTFSDVGDTFAATLGGQGLVGATGATGNTGPKGDRGSPGE